MPNLLISLKHQAEQSNRRSYNRFTRPNPGLNDPMNPMNPIGINQDILTIIECCESFEQQFTPKNDFTIEDASPDSYFHGRWLQHCLTDIKKNTYDEVRADKLMKSLGW